MSRERDEEILELLVKLGNGRAQAMRRLAVCKSEDDKKLLHRRLKEQVRLSNARSERARRRNDQERDAKDGDDWLRAERFVERGERSAQGNPLERIARAVQAMEIAEVGPTKAQAMSHTSGRGSGDPTDGMRQAPPGAMQGFTMVADDWRGRLVRLARLAEHELDLLRGDATVLVARGSADRTRRILGWEGEELSWIAYVEQVSERTIFRLIKDHSDQGYRVRGGRLLRQVEEPDELAA